MWNGGWAGLTPSVPAHWPSTQHFLQWQVCRMRLCVSVLQLPAPQTDVCTPDSVEHFCLQTMGRGSKPYRKRHERAHPDHLVLTGQRA